MPHAKLGWHGALRLAQSIARENRVVRARDMLERNAANAWLTDLSGWDFERIGHGMYVQHGDKVDPLIVTARKYPRFTLSLTSALWLHGIHTERPAHDWWIIPRTARDPKFAAPNARWLRSSWAKDDRVQMHLERSYVATHTPERALLECVRHRKLIADELVTALLDRALKSGAVTEDGLARRAAALHVLAPLQAVLNARAPATAF